DDIAAAKRLGDQAAALGTLGIHGVQQHLHRIVAVQHDILILNLAAGTAGQQEVVHGGQFQLRVVKAHSHTGAEQGGDGAFDVHRPAGRMDIQGGAFEFAGGGWRHGGRSESVGDDFLRHEVERHDLVHTPKVDGNLGHAAHHAGRLVLGD